MPGLGSATGAFAGASSEVRRRLQQRGRRAPRPPPKPKTGCRCGGLNALSSESAKESAMAFKGKRRAAAGREGHFYKSCCVPVKLQPGDAMTMKIIVLVMNIIVLSQV